MGLLSKLSGDRRGKLDEFLAEHRQPGEQPVAAIPMCSVVGGVFPDAERGFAFHGISVTDRALYVVGWGVGLPERPKQVVASVPRESVAIDEYKAGRLTSGRLVLRLEHGEPVSFEIPGLHRGDANELVKSLRGTA